MAVDEFKFTVLAYNIHSLINFDERMERLLFEIGDLHWDVLAISETWRKERLETWETTHGHIWFGSGGVEERAGVGFLLHNRWRDFEFAPISCRLATLDLKLTKTFQVRMFSVYMPHGGLPDDEVDTMYSMMDSALERSRRNGHHIILAGDFNAEVGSCMEWDDGTIIGPSPLHNRSARGEWFISWCSLQELRLSNTFGCSKWQDAWTYRNGGSCKVLDHILVDKRLTKNVMYCKVLG